jgi:hypothetical protein
MKWTMNATACVKWVTLLTLAVSAVVGCEEDREVVGLPEPPPWEIIPDSMNFGILIVDYLSYSFEGGTVDHYPLCGNGDVDSLPIAITRTPPVDMGDVTVRYTCSGDTLLYATQIWGGVGEIKQPARFLPPSMFHRVGTQPSPPVSLEYLEFTQEWLVSRADTVWATVQHLDVVQEFSTAEYRAAVFLYSPSSGGTDPEWEYVDWLVFLYRAATSQ